MLATNDLPLEARYAARVQPRPEWAGSLLIEQRGCLGLARRFLWARPQDQHRSEYVLVADPGMSILTMVRVWPQCFAAREAVWYEEESFASQFDRMGLLAITKKEIDGARGKAFREQLFNVADGDVIPSAREVVLTMIVHFGRFGEWLLTGSAVRTADVDSSGRRVIVSLMSGGVGLLSDWDVFSDDRLGILGARSVRVPEESQ